MIHRNNPSRRCSGQFVGACVAVFDDISIHPKDLPPCLVATRAPRPFLRFWLAGDVPHMYVHLQELIFQDIDTRSSCYGQEAQSVTVLGED